MIGNLSSGFLLQNTKEYIEKLEYQKQALTNLVRHMVIIKKLDDFVLFSWNSSNIAR